MQVAIEVHNREAEHALQTRDALHRKRMETRNRHGSSGLQTVAPSPVMSALPELPAPAPPRDPSPELDDGIDEELVRLVSGKRGKKARRKGNKRGATTKVASKRAGTSRKTALPAHKRPRPTQAKQVQEPDSDVEMRVLSPFRTLFDEDVGDRAPAAPTVPADPPRTRASARNRPAEPAPAPAVTSPARTRSQQRPRRSTVSNVTAAPEPPTSPTSHRPPSKKRKLEVLRLPVTFTVGGGATSATLRPRPRPKLQSGSVAAEAYEARLRSRTSRGG